LPDFAAPNPTGSLQWGGLPASVNRESGEAAVTLSVGELVYGMFPVELGTSPPKNPPPLWVLGASVLGPAGIACRNREVERWHENPASSSDLSCTKPAQKYRSSI